MKSQFKCFAVAAASAFAFTATAQVVAPTVADYVTDGLVVHWDAINNVAADQPHDNASTVWNDLTGNGFNWTIAGGASWSDTALVLKGTGGCGTMSGKKVADFENKITTVELVYANDEKRDGIIFTPGFGQTTYLYTDRQGRVGFYGPSSGTRYGCYTTIGETNSFSVVYTRGENVAKPSGCTSLRFNAVDTEFSGMGDYWEKSMYTIYLGARSGSSPYAKGRLCAIRIYNRVLTTQEKDQNYRIDQYRFLGLTKRFNMVAAENASTVEELTFTDEESGDPIPAENFDVVFYPVDNDGVRRITAVGKAGSGYDKVFNSVYQQTSSLPYYAITFDCPTDYVDVTIVGEEGKVKGDTYEFGSQVTITATAKDGVTPFGRWLVGVPEEDALKASITYTVGEENYLVPYFVFPWVYENGTLSDGYFTVSASCAADGVSLTLNNTKAPQYLFAGISDMDFTKPIVGGYQVVSVSGAFAWDGKVTSVSLPDTVTTLGYRAFYSTSNLTNVNLRADSITTIGESAFQGASKLKGFNGTPDVVFTNLSSINQLAFQSCSAIAGRVELDGPAPLGFLNPGSGVGVFEGCTGVKEVRIGDAFTNVCNYCVFNCWSMTNLYLGAGIKRIPERLTAVKGNGAYASLKVLTLAGEIEALGSGAFMGQPIVSINGSSDVVFRGLDTFGQGVFSGPKITSAVIEGKKTGVDVDVASSVGNGSFEGCATITNVVIEGGFTGLGAFPFLKCTKLVNIELPRSFNTFTDRFFGNCQALRTVTMGAFPTSTHDRMFEGMPSNQVLFMVPDTAEWRAFAAEYVTPWSGVDAAVKAKYDAYGYPKRIPYGVVNSTYTGENGKPQTEEGIYVPNGSFFSFISPLGTLMLIK